MAHTDLLRIGAAAVLSSAAGAHSQMTWFVDADAPPGGDGLAWATAFDELQPAMELALPGDEIWVAEGVYVPSVIDPIAGEDQPYFLMPDGVALLGGFRGDETAADQRDPETYESVISGDLLGNDLDMPVTGGIASSQEMEDLFVSLGDNTGTLLFVDRTGPGTRLDGLVFQDAFTDRGDPGFSPADRNGVFVMGSILDISNCVFRENRSAPGAALFVISCEGSQLDFDFASQHPCGEVTFGLPSAVVIEDTDFVDNIDNFGQGASGVIGASAIISDSLFLVENSNFEFSRSAAFSDDVLFAQVAVGQPGLWITGNSEGIVSGTRFIRCSPAIQNRGTPASNGIAALGVGVGRGPNDYATADIIGCEFISNLAAPFGVVRFWGGGGSIANSVFLGNRSYEYSSLTQGGAASVVVGALDTRSPDIATVIIRQNLFVGNTRLSQDPDYDLDRALPIISSFARLTRAYYNTFVDNDTGDSGIPTIQLSRNESFESGTLGADSMTLDPLFVRPPSDGGDGWGDDPFTPDIDEGLNDDLGDLRLLAGSPAIDRGATIDFVSIGLVGDFDGNERNVDDPGIADGVEGSEDLGAYEFQGVTCLPDVNRDGQVTPADFSAWITAFNDTSPLADQNRDGAVTPADFSAWIMNFNMGC